MSNKHTLLMTVDTQLAKAIEAIGVIRKAIDQAKSVHGFPQNVIDIAEADVKGFFNVMSGHDGEDRDRI